MRGEFKLAIDSIAIPTYRLELGEIADPYVITGEAKLDTGANPEFLLTAEGQALAIDYVRHHPAWRLSLQTHKWLGVR